MNMTLQLAHEVGRHVEVAVAGGVALFRYVYAPETPVREAQRPYVHPLRSLAGDALTNFRPNDHPWHHALSLTLTSVGGVNFWGGAELSRERWLPVARRSRGAAAPIVGGSRCGAIGRVGRLV